MDAIQVYAILNKRIRGLTSGIRSAVVQGQSIVFTMNDGSTQTMTFPTPADGKDGSSITNVEIRQVGNDYHLFCTITDADGNDQEIDSGVLPNTKITSDAAPTQGSKNLVESGGVFDALQLKQDKLVGTDGQFLSFDAQGNPISVELPDLGSAVIEISKADYLLLTEAERKDKVYYVYDDNDNGQCFVYADKRPTTTNANMGDIVFNSLPEPNGFVGWVYTAFGWLGFGQIESATIKGFTLADNTIFMVNDGQGGGTPFLYADMN